MTQQSNIVIVSGRIWHYGVTSASERAGWLVQKVRAATV